MYKNTKKKHKKSRKKKTKTKTDLLCDDMLLQKWFTFYC